MATLEGNKSIEEALKFLFCGGIAAIANMAARFVLTFFISYRAAIVIAYCIGMATGFLLFKLFVFHTRGSRKTTYEILWFVLVNVFALAQTYVISVALSEHAFPRIGMIPHSQDIAHIIGVMAPVVTSYFGHKHLTFARGKS